MKTKVLTGKKRWELDKRVQKECEVLKSNLSEVAFLSIFPDPIKNIETAIIGYHEG